MYSDIIPKNSLFWRKLWMIDLQSFISFSSFLITLILKGMTSFVSTSKTFTCDVISNNVSVNLWQENKYLDNLNGLAKN